MAIVPDIHVLFATEYFRILEIFHFPVVIQRVFIVIVS